MVLLHEGEEEPKALIFCFSSENSEYGVRVGGSLPLSIFNIKVIKYEKFNTCTGNMFFGAVLHSG